MNENLKKLIDAAAAKGCMIFIAPAGGGGYNVSLGKPTTPEKEYYEDIGWLGHGATLEAAVEESMKSTI